MRDLFFLQDKPFHRLIEGFAINLGVVDKAVGDGFVIILYLILLKQFLGSFADHNLPTDPVALHLIGHAHVFPVYVVTHQFCSDYSSDDVPLCKLI